MKMLVLSDRHRVSPNGCLNLDITTKPSSATEELKNIIIIILIMNLQEFRIKLILMEIKI